jgi:serine/threonine-protein phosphatase 6 regulatory subunit 3
MFRDMPAEPVSPLDAERLTKGVLQVQSAIVPRLSDFNSILLEPPQRPPIHTSAGLINKPLGATRLEVVHLIRALLSSNNPELNVKLVELKTVPILIVSLYQL